MYPRPANSQISFAPTWRHADTGSSKSRRSPMRASGSSTSRWRRRSKLAASRQPRPRPSSRASSSGPRSSTTAASSCASRAARSATSTASSAPSRSAGYSRPTSRTTRPLASSRIASPNSASKTNCSRPAQSPARRSSSGRATEWCSTGSRPSPRPPNSSPPRAVRTPASTTRSAAPATSAARSTSAAWTPRRPPAPNSSVSARPACGRPARKSSTVHPDPETPPRQRMPPAAHGRGTEIVLISSGAVATGMPCLKLEERPADLATQQAAASGGQNVLIFRYQESLDRYGIAAGTVLLTEGDVLNEPHKSNTRRALDRLLDLRILPVVNENDTVAVYGLRFGSNDRLAALVSTLIRADLLIMLSDVDALYTKPQHLPRATRIDHIAAAWCTTRRRR